MMPVPMITVLIMVNVFMIDEAAKTMMLVLSIPVIRTLELVTPSLCLAMMVMLVLVINVKMVFA